MSEHKKRGRKAGFKHSEETKKKMSESHKRAWKNKSKNGYGKIHAKLKQGLHTSGK